MNIVELTKKLISISSFVDENNNEAALSEYIFIWLKNNCPWLDIRKQNVEDGRFNIIAQDKADPKILFANHIDTVEPKRGGKFNPLECVEENGLLYGLGAVDRKGGIASLLSALTNFKKTKGLALLFYIDEEYDFKGMNKFLENFNWQPELVIGCESDFQIVNGCRGFIELVARVKGLSGHSARPFSGKNAIWGLLQAVKELDADMNKFKDFDFGVSTLNLSSLRGGTLKNKKGEDFILSLRSNNIPDFAEALIEIRTSVFELNADYVVNFLKNKLLGAGYQVDFLVKNDLRGYKVSKNKIKPLEKVIRELGFAVKYKNLQYRGYSDLAMINEKFGCPAVNFGPRGANKHSINEYVDIQSLQDCKIIYNRLIEEFCG